MRKTILAILLALPMTIFAQKIGHVNTALVVEGMSDYTALKAEIETLKKQFSDEIQRKQTDIQTKADAYEKEKANLSETLRAYREQELQKAYEEYQQFVQTSDGELQKVYQAKMATIQEKMMGAVKEVGEAEGFSYVLDAASIPFIGATATDITDKVKAKLGVK